MSPRVLDVKILLVVSDQQIVRVNVPASSCFGLCREINHEGRVRGYFSIITKRVL
jgi:hypothetical protein